MTGLTRGPLPAEVYWRRRIAFLGMLALLVIGLARLMPGGGHDAQATNAAHVSAGSSRSTHAPTPSATTTPSGAAAESTTTTTFVDPTTSVPVAPVTPTTSVPPTPTAVCSDDDIAVVPSVTDAQATKPVIFSLAITSKTTPACLWDVSPSTLQLKVTSGSDRIWSTLDCPKAVPNQRVTIQRDVPTNINIRWNTRRSEAGCPTETGWANLGFYHVAVAALGGEPDDVQFKLGKPTKAPATPLPPVVTTPGATAPTASTAPGAPAAGAAVPPAAAETAPAASPSGGSVPNRHLRRGLKAD